MSYIPCHIRTFNLKNMSIQSEIESFVLFEYFLLVNKFKYNFGLFMCLLQCNSNYTWMHSHHNLVCKCRWATRGATRAEARGACLLHPACERACMRAKKSPMSPSSQSRMKLTRPNSKTRSFVGFTAEPVNVSFRSIDFVYILCTSIWNNIVHNWVRTLNTSDWFDAETNNITHYLYYLPTA